MKPFFQLQSTSSKARAGLIQTTRGEIPTPQFMPVGTRGAVKSLTTEDVESLNPPIILGNTYHLYLRPGHHLIESLGGLHRFMDWKKPILTDSGGFQVFSLSDLNQVTENGVHFRSHIDGSKHFMTPELSMEIQRSLGSDIVMCFDECPALPADDQTLEASLKRTHAWARRCRDYPLADHQFLFGIVQGGLNLHLRLESLSQLNAMDFSGLAIGGLSVGEKNEQMQQLLADFTPHMPENKPRYLMGVGKPLDILNAIACGVDLFDCVLPTRNARNGGVFTAKGPINIKNERFKTDLRPLDPDCSCRVCARHSRAYLNHLFKVGEYTAAQLMTYHNLDFFLSLTRRARESILSDRFDEFYRSFYKEYTGKSEEE